MTDKKKNTSIPMYLTSFLATHIYTFAKKVLKIETGLIKQYF